MSPAGSKNTSAAEPLNPALQRLYDAAKKLAATRARLEMWQNVAWVLTPTITDPVTGKTVVPRPDPLPRHTS
ncbi:hypothetical protein [Gemmata sp.]|uniref:hypothetical protein n=1 Tax=Gemmata sp. TaxID=1914242 RepID=UPI003F6F9141